MEAVEDALSDKDALEHMADSFKCHAALEGGLAFVFGAFDAVCAVTNEAGGDDGDDVNDLRAADSTSTTEGQGPHARGQGQAHREEAYQRVDDGVECEHH